MSKHKRCNQQSFVWWWKQMTLCSENGNSHATWASSCNSSRLGKYLARCDLTWNKKSTWWHINVTTNKGKIVFTLKLDYGLSVLVVYQMGNSVFVNKIFQEYNSLKVFCLIFSRIISNIIPSESTKQIQSQIQDRSDQIQFFSWRIISW